jgi:hypothetical protein
MNHPEAIGLSHAPHSDAVSTGRSAARLLALTDAELARVDPVEMNILVAKGIPGLADLDVRRYQRMADDWAGDIRRRLPAAEVEFHKSPLDWKNDIRFFRLGMVCWYVDQVLGIRYREDQRDLKRVVYTDPSDLFLNGVMDSRRGTCGNMATLHVALGWRLGWPVSLACVGSHFICRYDDGEITHNIEATKNGAGGFHSHPDDYYRQENKLPPKAVTCGSDLRAVTLREMLGLFFGARGRYFDNANQLEQAEADYLVARSLFPRNRQLFVAQNQVSVQCSVDRFEPGEPGHPTELVCWLQEVVRSGHWNHTHFAQSYRETTYDIRPDGLCADE